MAEEFQESEIVFLESVGEDELRYENSDSPPESGKINCKRRRVEVEAKKNKKSISVPVNIPRNCVYWDIDGDEGREIVPPHIIVGRRVAGKMMAFSVCTGKGRTLKGRDLRQVRNSILRMTGFLET